MPAGGPRAITTLPKPTLSLTARLVDLRIDIGQGTGPYTTTSYPPRFGVFVRLTKWDVSGTMAFRDQLGKLWPSSSSQQGWPGMT